MAESNPSTNSSSGGGEEAVGNIAASVANLKITGPSARKITADDIEQFIVTRKYGVSRRWSRRTVIACHIKHNGLKGDPIEGVYRNTRTDKIHAETYFLADVAEIIAAGGASISIDVFMNYSPCHECAGKIRGFVGTHRSKVTKINIKFANFYNITKHDTNSAEDAGKNQNGLHLLWKAGIELSVFSTEEDWVQFLFGYTFVGADGTEKDRLLALAQHPDRREREKTDVKYLVNYIKNEITADDIKQFIVPFKYGENVENWPRQPVMACCIKYKGPEGDLAIEKVYPSTSYSCRYNNIYHTHAEIYFLEGVAGIIKAGGTSISIDVFMNYSPCHGCAGKIREFVARHRSEVTKMHIKFANFYKITAEYAGNSAAKANREGLHSLWKVKGIELSVFSTEEDWRQFLCDYTFVGAFLKNAQKNDRKNREKTDVEILEKIIKGIPFE